MDESAPNDMTRSLTLLVFAVLLVIAYLAGMQRGHVDPPRQVDPPEALVASLPSDQDSKGPDLVISSDGDARAAIPSEIQEPAPAEDDSSEPAVGPIARGMLEGASECVQTAAYRLPDLYATFLEQLENGESISHVQSFHLLGCAIVVLQYARGQPPEPCGPDGEVKFSLGEDGWWSFYQNSRVIRFHESDYPEYAALHRGYRQAVEDMEKPGWKPGNGVPDDVLQQIRFRAEEALVWLGK